ncbi:lysozyme [Martelella alba]|uniref:Lysozyme n=1 Tax=Martelella alba TaxID=2590451 RepID=A0ABY2SEG6_9HYPH|nr:lysozyme [Martelella alba]TKI01618.1 lysozyme [Martelella alba]
MAMSPALRKKLISASAGGAIAITVALLCGNDGLEGTKHYPYRDVGGVWTVCTGHTGKDTIPGKYYSDAECNVLLADDLQSVKKEVDADIKVPIDPYMRAAMYSFAFNVGVNAFRHASLLHNLNAGNQPAACDGLRQWVRVNDQRNRGLINRREIERTVCMMGQK